METKEGEVVCDFCGKHQKFIESLVASKQGNKSVGICNECIERSYEIIVEARSEKQAQQAKAE